MISGFFKIWILLNFSHPQNLDIMKQKKKRERKCPGLRRRLSEKRSDSLKKVCKIYFIWKSFDIDG